MSHYTEQEMHDTTAEQEVIGGNATPVKGTNSKEMHDEQAESETRSPMSVDDHSSETQTTQTQLRTNPDASISEALSGLAHEVFSFATDNSFVRWENQGFTACVAVLVNWHLLFQLCCASCGVSLSGIFIELFLSWGIFVSLVGGFLLFGSSTTRRYVAGYLPAGCQSAFENLQEQPLDACHSMVSTVLQHEKVRAFKLERLLVTEQQCVSLAGRFVAFTFRVAETVSRVFFRIVFWNKENTRVSAAVLAFVFFFGSTVAQCASHTLAVVGLGGVEAFYTDSAAALLLGPFLFLLADASARSLLIILGFNGLLAYGFFRTAVDAFVAGKVAEVAPKVGPVYAMCVARAGDLLEKPMAIAGQLMEKVPRYNGEAKKAQ